MKNISKGTIIRTIMLVFVIVNLVLKCSGHEVIEIEESQVSEWLEMLISVATIIVCYWKNNSVSKKAILADQYLKQLQESEEV